jgi:GDP-L-fucose synthase
MKKKLLILGSNGMVGSAIFRLANKNEYNILAPTRKTLDLFSQTKVRSYFKNEKPNIVILAAAKAGGIYANYTYPADFIYENILIESNVISCAHDYKIEKMIFLGSSCIYPKNSKQPIKENYLLTGALEKTNEYYAISKIAGLKMVEAFKKQYNDNFISVMPTNIYGINDSFHAFNSHVIPALILKFFKAVKEKNNKVILWGTGKARRDFLYVDDVAMAIIFLINKYNGLEPINIGSGNEISIKSLAIKIAKILNFNGKILFNDKYPDGTLRKMLDISKISRLGWKPSYNLDDGLKITINWFLKNFTKNYRFLKK